MKCNSDRLWLTDTEAAYCKGNHEYISEPNKLTCQSKCEEKSNCVGVSYANSGQFLNLCYICLDDTLVSNGYGLNFFRKPGINGYRTDYKSTKRNHIYILHDRKYE